VDELTFYANMQTLLQARTPFVLVTLMSIKGSAPQDLGAKAIITEAGLLQGTVGGGKLEARAIEQAQRMLSSAEQASKQSHTWNLQRDIGMTCGGEVSLFFESFATHAWNIALFGAGHVIQALVPIVQRMPCQVYCVDPRQDWLDKLPKSTNLQTFAMSDPTESVALVPKDSFVCLITQGHSTDVPILIELFRQPHRYPYIGMIGSNTKAVRVRKALEQEGFSTEQIAELHSPIGLPIGSNHPTEIAISILAELLQVRDRFRSPV
jgi:xanthine dehydrogenase accessory factor